MSRLTRAPHSAPPVTGVKSVTPAGAKSDTITFVATLSSASFVRQQYGPGPQVFSDPYSNHRDLGNVSCPAPAGAYRAVQTVSSPHIGIPPYLRFLASKTP
jgi:hypothetical protein